jgi:hypothetical protein
MSEVLFCYAHGLTLTVMMTQLFDYFFLLPFLLFLGCPYLPSSGFQLLFPCHGHRPSQRDQAQPSPYFSFLLYLRTPSPFRTFGLGDDYSGVQGCSGSFRPQVARSLALSQCYPHPPYFYRHALHPCSWLHGTHGESQPSCARQAVNGGDRRGSDHHQENRNGQQARGVCVCYMCGVLQCNASKCALSRC